jgi:DNA-binding CsgD family transcriptional regulator
VSGGEMNENQIRFLFNQLIINGLTYKQATIVRYILKDLNTIEIAEKIFISDKTVKSHLTQIYKKLNIKNRISLVLFCVRILNNQGLISQC